MKDVIYIPGSLKRADAIHIEAAWNEDEFDYEEYDLCFSSISDSDEKLNLASNCLRNISKHDEGMYTDYMKRSAAKIASRLVEQKKEKEFAEFIKKDYLSENSFNKIFKLCSDAGFTSGTACLLEHREKKNTRKNAAFRLRI